MIDMDSSPGQSHLETILTRETAILPYNYPECISQPQFRVGRGVTTMPFVTPSQLRTHLGLLRTFHELKFKVQEDSDTINAFPPLARALDSEARWI